MAGHHEMDAPVEGDGASPELDARYDDALELNKKLRQMVMASETGELDIPPELMAMLGESAGLGLGGSAPGGPPPAATGGYRSAMDFLPAAGGSGGAGLTGTKRRPKKKTVKSAPRVGAAPLPKANYTFNDDSLHRIGKGNAMLMDRLTAINAGKGVMQTRARKPTLRSSAAINRQRQAHKIVNDNAAFLKRLQNVKGTSSFSRKALAKDAKKQTRLKTLRRQVDGPAGTRKRAPRRKKRTTLPDMVF